MRSAGLSPPWKPSWGRLVRSLLQGARGEPPHVSVEHTGGQAPDGFPQGPRELRPTRPAGSGRFLRTAPPRRHAVPSVSARGREATAAKWVSCCASWSEGGRWHCGDVGKAPPFSPPAQTSELRSLLTFKPRPSAVGRRAFMTCCGVHGIVVRMRLCAFLGGPRFLQA